MDIFRRIADSFRRVKAWYTSRKNRRARRVAGAVADTAAAGTGLVLRTAVKTVMTVLLVFVTTGMILACIFAIYVKTCLTEELNLTPEELSSALSSHIWAETSPGSEQWQEVATLYATENRIWVDYDQIPINMVHAAVAIEDQRFYRHKGVDWWRTIGAFGSMFLSMDDTFGGSTLTQQLIKNLTGKNEVTVQRKLLEMFRALEFEKKYTKEEIVTWYLNEIYLSEGCYGVGAAAREYFNKEVWELDLAECASLIGITNNPSLYDPYIGPKSTERNKTRQELILKEMYKQEYITYDEYVAAKSEQLHFKRAEGEQREIPVNSYYVDSLVWELVEDLAEDRGITTRQAESLVYNGGYNIYSCMDLSIQQIVDDVFQNPENLPEAYYNVSGQKLSAAIVIMDPYDGSIVALEGDTGVKTGSFTDNYATELVRRPGSSFKPVAVYAPALDLGLITQNTSVNDSPNIRLRGTTWYPKNDGGGYSGVINIRTGLVLSRNTVAAQTLDRLGLQASWNYLTERFGFTSLVQDHLDEDTGQTVTDMAYAALGLGQLSYGVTAREMAQAYTAFVNDGIMSRARTYTMVTDDDGKLVLDNPADQHVAIKANTAWNISDMLQAAVSGGTGTAAYFGSTAVAGKTGTTSNNQDRYFTGFTKYYVAACWTGYKYPEQMYFYSNPAAMIWRSVMQPIHEGLPWQSFTAPQVGGGGSLWGNLVVTPDPNAETPPPTENAVPPEQQQPQQPQEQQPQQPQEPQTTIVPLTTPTPEPVVTIEPVVTPEPENTTLPVQPEESAPPTESTDSPVTGNPEPPDSGDSGGSEESPPPEGNPANLIPVGGA